MNTDDHQFRKIMNEKPGTPFDAAGKGDDPRSCFSRDFRKNLDDIFGPRGIVNGRPHSHTRKVYGTKKP